MNKLFTKAVIVEPRIECPTWISEKIEALFIMIIILEYVRTIQVQIIP
ncbi:hypothetical protein PbDSM24746_44290 [Paenibacillus macerans]|nr:hypothetical protein PbDSM24746_44290 [Paenibacillus macerans]GBK70989.1 hypothetical protein PbJCM17693_46970 [Paenibacillus macerans]